MCFLARLLVFHGGAGHLLLKRRVHSLHYGWTENTMVDVVKVVVIVVKLLLLLLVIVV